MATDNDFNKKVRLLKRFKMTENWHKCDNLGVSTWQEK